MKRKEYSIGDLTDVAEMILESLDGRNVVVFRGEMGAGKTTLISALCEVLGVEDDVTSPTFALVNNYLTAAGDDLYHFDLYRIDRIEEAYDMGYEEYFYGSGLCLVEWPEKVEELIPDDAMTVRLEVLSPTHRAITIE